MEIKIERLPYVCPRRVVQPPERTEDGAFQTRELEDLAERLRLWTIIGEWDLPSLPFLSTAQFDLNYSRMFRFDSYSAGMEQLISTLYPVGPHLFVIDPKGYCSVQCVPVRICPRGEEEWVSWPGELIPTDEWMWYAGFRGPLDEERWKKDPIRAHMEKELLVMSTFLLAQAAANQDYKDRLFVTAPGWPLAIRIR